MTSSDAIRLVLIITYVHMRLIWTQMTMLRHRDEYNEKDCKRRGEDFCEARERRKGEAWNENAKTVISS